MTQVKVKRRYRLIQASDEKSINAIFDDFAKDDRTATTWKLVGPVQIYQDGKVCIYHATLVVEEQAAA